MNELSILPMSLPCCLMNSVGMLDWLGRGIVIFDIYGLGSGQQVVVVTILRQVYRLLSCQDSWTGRTLDVVLALRFHYVLGLDNRC